MIRGIHGLLYSSDAEATRAFFRDKVKLPGSDVGEGWLIFDFKEGDLGIHPVSHGASAGAFQPFSAWTSAKVTFAP